ncbi:Glycoprotein H [Eptesicus fuscus gammaherpesvirus]|uniref:Glycoprotein H n=1 Tax=vespertilionid gammaherpesvirus 3 TaxID=2846598 RepID=A0A2D0ZXA9_9GAMA|nr:Glycoprotein H [Eptesicus fuscus gammaherpesvirus]ATA58251.1 Glycoprotein H [Eptesicus fuscus gammaherpesvirus]WAH70894.1 glycoprotein H [Eptesicus fuscus gammaherpesvirus]
MGSRSAPGLCGAPPLTPSVPLVSTTRTPSFPPTLPLLLLLFLLSHAAALPPSPRPPGTSGGDVLIVEIGAAGGPRYILDWGRVVSFSSKRNISLWWNQSYVDYPLEEVLDRQRYVYRIRGETVSSSGRPRRECSVAPHGRVLSLSVSPGASGAPLVGVPGYLGRVGVSSKAVASDFFTYRDFDDYEDALRGFIYSDIEPGLTRAFDLLTIADSYTFHGAVTPTHAHMVLTCRDASRRYGPVALFFGYSNALPVSPGFFLPDDVLLAKDSDFALWLVASNDPVENAHLVPGSGASVVGALNATAARDLFAVLANSSVEALMEGLERQLVSMEVGGNCLRDISPLDYFLLFFKLVAAEFRLVAIPTWAGSVVDLGCISERLVHLRHLQRLASGCFNTYRADPIVTPSLARAAAAQAAAASLSSVSSLSESDRRDLITLYALAVDEPSMEDRVIKGLAAFMDALYTSFTYGFDLHPWARRALFGVYGILHSGGARFIRADVDNEDLRSAYVLATSMCTSSEISTLVSRFSGGHALEVRDIFSPCFMSLRFDFTRDKLVSQSMQSVQLSSVQTRRGASGLLEFMRATHIATSLNVLPVSRCLDHSGPIFLAVPLKDLTYIVSSVPVQNALVYRVYQTFLRSTIVISAVRPDCTPFSPTDGVGDENNLTLPFPRAGPRRIPVVYNFSHPRTSCTLCHSALLSYDELDGLLSMMYITNRHVQNNMFTDLSPFFDNNNLHTHYLLLMSNGTVIELRGLYRRHVADGLLYTIFFISLAVALFIAYKLIVKCF